MNKFTQLLYEALNNKEIRCNDCSKLVKFVSGEQLKKETDKKPYVCGSTMICKECEYNDDITQGNVRFKYGCIDNLGDYLREKGLFNEIKTWEEALSILESIEVELEDRKRITIKKEGEVTLEERRATELKDALKEICSAELHEDEDGFWEVLGGTWMKGGEGNAVGYKIAFAPDENRVTMIFFVHNVKKYASSSDTIHNFEKLMLKNKSMKRLRDQQELHFGCSEDGEGVVAIQYIFDEYSLNFIIDTIFCIYKTAAQNIYNLDFEEENNKGKTNAETYEHMRKLAELLEGFNDAIDEIYLEEDDYHENEEYFDEINEKKLNVHASIGISNTQILDNSIDISTGIEYYEEDFDKYITVSSVKENNKLVYSLLLNDCVIDEYIELGKTDDIHKALTGILNARQDVRQGAKIDTDNLFEVREELPEYKYAKDKVGRNGTYNALVMLASTLEIWNKHNEELIYNAHEIFSHGLGNTFSISSHDLHIRGQFDFGKHELYRVSSSKSDGFLEDQTLREVMEFIICEMGINPKTDECIEEYIEEARKNPVANLRDSQYKKLDFEEANEAIRVFNVLDNLHGMKTYPSEYACENCSNNEVCIDCDYIDECDMNPCDCCDKCMDDEDEYNGDYFKDTTLLHVDIDKHMIIDRPYIELDIEHEDSIYMIRITDLQKNGSNFTYHLTIINKGKSINKLVVEGIENLISLITNIKLYGDSTLNSENMFSYNEDIDFDNLMKYYIVPERRKQLIDLFKYIRKNYKEIDVDLFITHYIEGAQAKLTTRSDLPPGEPGGF